jgi:UDP-GlcNAc:undecaprenyl-phosphate/decaprenyl-phosphate GlcNAc-1-phosphate transferase
VVTYLFLVIIPFCASLILTPLVRALAVRIGAIDQPGERKIHVVSMPRLGGMGVVGSAVLTGLTAVAVESWRGGVLTFNLEAWTPVFLGGTIVFLGGVWDDLRTLPAWVKFLFQAMAAGIAIWFGIQVERVSFLGSGSIALGVLAFPLTFLWIVGITNAFNLVDGLDGLAAGLAIIAAGSCATIFFLSGDTQDVQLILILLGALLGFLPYNFNPATIFLGDSGSLVVGYVLAVTAITGSRRGAQALAVAIPLLIFGVPIIDTLLSMTRRFVGSLRLLRAPRARLKEYILCARYMFAADQRHIHHRLLALGLSHRNAVLLLYALALGLSGLAFLSVLAQYRNAGVILLAVGLATFIGVRKLGYDEMTFLRRGTLLHWYEEAQFNRRFFLGFVDMVLMTLAYWGAFLLKYEPPWTNELMVWYGNAFPCVLVLQLVVFATAGLYRGVCRAAEVGDLIHVAWVTLLAVALSYVCAVLRLPPQGTPGFFAIDALALGTLVVSVRSTYRVLEYLLPDETAASGTALIYGAGQDGQLLLRELQRHPHLELQPIGFLDDDPTLHHRMVQRVPVLGSGEALKGVIDRQPIAALILSSSGVQGYRVRRAISLCQERGIPVLRGDLQLLPVSTNDRSLPSRPVELHDPAT